MSSYRFHSRFVRTRYTGGRCRTRSSCSLGGDSWFDNLFDPTSAIRSYRSGQEDQVHFGGFDQKDKFLVRNVDLKVTENARAHHTDEFDVTDPDECVDQQQLVLRRGQVFFIDVQFTRPYDEAKDDLKFVFSMGNRPKPSKGTLVKLILSDKDEPKEWGAYIKSKNKNTITVAITTPPDCKVGKWGFKIDVIKTDDKDEESVFRWEHSDPICMLFNPWCKDDEVYMPDERLLKEYVLNDTGIIYVGSFKRISPRPWIFGQFTGNVLDCCMYLLEKSGLTDNDRGDPVQVARNVSKIVNSSDDDGVLTGNWSGNYTDGTSPLSWNGSVSILEKYYRTKQPVEFGQCWVFSGVTTTVCRALGIPARSVTNFASAHDTDGSITIDSYFTTEGKPLEGESADSTWEDRMKNFHVWNDVWMARADLPTGYGGWQAIDATPQELSAGNYCMGPVSLNAIKRGELGFEYDAKFAFAEVNGDRVSWMVCKDGSVRVAKIQKNAVGKFISTKAPFKKEREDVTKQYKYEEGTPEERAAVRRANKHSTLEEEIYETGSKDVEFELDMNHDSYVGDDIEATLKLKNTSSDRRMLNGTITLSTMHYTGVKHRNIIEQPINLEVLKPNEDKLISITVPVEDYWKSMVDHCMIKLSCFVIVRETKQTFADIVEGRLLKPDLTIKAPAKGKVGEPMKVEVSFLNALPVSLMNTELRIEGPGLQKERCLKQRLVKSHQTFVTTFEMKPAKKGEREIVLNFNSDELYLTGSHVVEVQ